MRDECRGPRGSGVVEGSPGVTSPQPFLKPFRATEGLKVRAIPVHREVGGWVLADSLRLMADYPLFGGNDGGLSLSLKGVGVLNLGGLSCDIVSG